MKAIIVALFLCAFLFSDLSAARRLRAANLPINIIHTTDIHGWYFGHPHNETLNADFGDFHSLVQHLLANAQAAGEEFFLFDTGDLIEGTGLSDATPIHGQYVFPIVQNVTLYNGLAIGNHDIGHPDVVDLMLQTFIPYWNPSSENAKYTDKVFELKKYGTAPPPRYLTANSFMLSSMDFIGQPYSVIDTKLGTRVLVIGYIYNFTHEANNTVVTDVSVSVTQSYFNDAMQVPNVDIIVTINHIAPQFGPELGQIYKAVRQVHPDTPFVLLSGHSHEEDFVKYDANAFTLESGKYFEIIGKIYFELGSDGSMENLATKWIDTSLSNFISLSGVPASQFLTPEGKVTKDLIWYYYNLLALNTTYGCSPQTFSPYAYYKDSWSLYNLYIEDIFPDVIWNATARGVNGTGFFLTNTATLRYDLYSGPVNRNDIYTVSPFNDTFYHIPGLTGAQLLTLMKSIDDVSELARDPRSRALCDTKLTYSTPPWYFSTIPVSDDKLYDLVLASYDAQTIAPVVQKLFGNKFKSVPFDTVNDTAALQLYVQNTWPCKSSEA
eukprot:TRINITY_DN2916_c0_g1_i1.p1 TRINITY_DN2916_c0_g1~~TRINITY_DN2916_c0_g1_i1.p1  ORF type:complete len:551 (-),score=112.53 TRINITY_DN2916_c0_g1_i1:390-2042(-)